MDDHGDSSMRLAPMMASLGRDPRAALDRLAAAGFRSVQLDGMMPGLRPRELDRSARRDLAATLRRRGLAAAGIDLWIPPEHFHDPATSDRAVAAVLAAIELAGALARCPVSVCLPAAAEGSADRGQSSREALVAHGQRHGVAVADHGLPIQDTALVDGMQIGIDPASWLARDEDPVRAIIEYHQRLAVARLCDLLTTGARAPVGDPREGRLDVAAYRSALAEAEHRRAVVIDTRHWADPWAGIEQSVVTWRRAG